MGRQVSQDGPSDDRPDPPVEEPPAGADEAPVPVEEEPAEAEPVLAEAEPVLAEAEPVLAEAEPVLAEAEPVLAEAEPVPAVEGESAAEPEPAAADEGAPDPSVEPAVEQVSDEVAPDGGGEQGADSSGESDVAEGGPEAEDQPAATEYEPETEPKTEEGLAANEPDAIEGEPAIGGEPTTGEESATADENQTSRGGFSSGSWRISARLGAEIRHDPLEVHEDRSQSPTSEGAAAHATAASPSAEPAVERVEPAVEKPEEEPAPTEDEPPARDEPAPETAEESAPDEESEPENDHSTDAPPDEDLTVAISPDATVVIERPPPGDATVVIKPGPPSDATVAVDATVVIDTTVASDATVALPQVVPVRPAEPSAPEGPPEETAEPSAPEGPPEETAEPSAPEGPPEETAEPSAPEGPPEETAEPSAPEGPPEETDVPATWQSRLAGAGRAVGAAAKRLVAGPVWRTAIAVVVIVIAVLAAVLVAQPSGPKAPPAVAPSAEPAPPPVLTLAKDAGATPDPAVVKAALDPLMVAALGSRINVSIVDPATGVVIYARQAGTMITPASTTKLLTAAAVLAARGPAYRLTTRAVAGAHPGEVVLVGGGDPTLSVNGKQLFPGAARLDQLAAQVRTRLGATTPVRVMVDTSLFTGPGTAPGWDPDVIAPGGQVAAIQPLMTDAGRIQPVHHEVGPDPRYADPALSTGRFFARMLAVKAPVTRGLAPPVSSSPAPAPPGTVPLGTIAPSTIAPGTIAPGTIAPGTIAPGTIAPGTIAPGTELGAVESPPLIRITDWMLTQSDNTIAEALGRQVALASGQPASFAGASAAIVRTLGGLGLRTSQIALSDASGLSRRNATSPATLTAVLSLAASGRYPALSGVFSGLPVAGWSGTLRGRFAAPAANTVGRGVVRAKTGSLSGVNTMAGQLVTSDGRLLVFAIMVNGSSDVYAARTGLDAILATVVRCGC